MAIPEINQYQVDALVDMATGIGGASLPVPDSKLDSYDHYSKLTSELCDLNQLVILGLLKDITKDCGEKLATMYAMSGRQFRVYQITETGKSMFSGPERAIQ